MWQFVKYAFATVFGLFLFLIISLLIIVGVGSVVSSSDSEYEVKENSILKLDFNRPIVENAATEDSPLNDIPNPFFSDTDKLGLIQVLAALERARVDPKIKGIYLDVSFPLAAYAQLSEIRDALAKFKESKKFIYAYANSYSERAIIWLRLPTKYI